MTETNTYDLTGLKCPMPIIHLNRIVKELAPGEECCIVADDLAFCPDLAAWCRRTGHILVNCDKVDSRTVARVRKQEM